MKINRLLYIFLFVFAFWGCSDDDNSVDNNKVQITSFTPTKGNIGTQVIIIGENFPTNKASIGVKFNGVAAMVDSVTHGSGSTAKIYTHVPTSATTGKISVTIAGTEYKFSQDFEIVSTNPSLMQFRVGNSWVYEKFQLDSNNIQETSNPTMDSVNITGTVTKINETAFAMSIFTKTNPQSDYVRGAEQFYYEIGSIIYTHSNWFDELMDFGGGSIELPFDISEQWLKLIDPQMNEWSIYTRAFANEPLSFGTLTGNLTLTATNAGTQNVTIGTEQFANTRQIDYKFKFIGTADTQFGQIPLNLERVLTVWYAPGVGKIKARMLSMRFVVPGLMNQIIPGYVQTIVRYHLN